MKIPILLLQLLVSATFLAVEASFGIGPLGKWKVENSNSYIIYNGVYIPNPEEMIDPSEILDSLNPVSSFNNFWKTMPSLNIFGGSDATTGADQNNNQYNGDQYSANPSTMSASYESPQSSGSSPMGSYATYPESSMFSGTGLSNMLGFTSADPPATSPSYSAEEDTTESDSGYSSYLPWNWFGGSTETSDEPSNQIPEQFQFLMNTPFQMNRRSSNSEEDHLHDANKEKVSVFYRPIGQGGYLRYEVHEPIENASTVNKAQAQLAPAKAPAPGQAVPPKSRIQRRSLIGDEDELDSSAGEKLSTNRDSKQYVPRSLRKSPRDRDQEPPRAPGISKKKSSVQYNRRRYQQLQKQKKRFSPSGRSSLLAQIQKIKRSDDSSMTSKDDPNYPCPKVGFWSYNGEVCIALGPVPKWACKPNDLLASGKLVVCRNKIMMS